MMQILSSRKSLEGFWTIPNRMRASPSLSNKKRGRKAFMHRHSGRVIRPLPRAYMHHIGFLPIREGEGCAGGASTANKTPPAVDIAHRIPKILNRWSLQTYREGILTFLDRFNPNPSEADQEAENSLSRATHHGDKPMLIY